jgi:hypothetical protein
MMKVSLFAIPLIVLSGAVWAESATQTDWSGGPGVAGPVSTWTDDFYLGTDLDWDTEPGQLKLVINKAENVIDPSVAQAYGCELADMDGDGYRDMVGCSRSGDYVSWWRNTNAGTTWTEHTIGFINGPVFLCTADIDGDGDRDVFVAAADGDEVAWFRNNDHGSSWTKFTIEAGFDARQISIGDFDGDGDTDLAGVSSETGDVVWWRNRISEGLPWLKTYVDGALLGAYACDTGDVDLDGDFDIVATSTTGNTVVLYTNEVESTGTWVKSTVGSGVMGPYSVLIANVDEDGRPEIVVARLSGISYFDYVGGTTWNNVVINNSVASVRSIVGFDFDGDGDVDLASCSAGSSDDVCWFQNLPGSSWEMNVVDNDFQDGVCILAGDIDNDGVPDIAGAASGENRISWWRIGGFKSPGILYSSILEISQPGYWQYLIWSYEQPYGTSIFFNLRASDNPSAMGPWSAGILDPGSIIGILEDGRSYLQYKVTLQTAYHYATPSLKDLTITWSPTGIEEGEGDRVLTLSSPNPCFGSVDLDWTLVEPGNVTLSVYDASGRIVRIVESGWFEAGTHSSVVDGLPGGVYAACLQGRGFTAMHRLVMLD